MLSFSDNVPIVSAHSDTVIRELKMAYFSFKASSTIMVFLLLLDLSSLFWRLTHNTIGQLLQQQ